jgi:hypothetical protein
MNKAGSALIHIFDVATFTGDELAHAFTELEEKYMTHAAWGRHPDDFAEVMANLRGKAKSCMAEETELAAM